MQLPTLQLPFFGDNNTNLHTTGSNLITNGTFNVSLTGWTADEFIWSSGTASYQWTVGCYRGSIRQDVSITAFKRYKLTFKYKASSYFDLVIRVRDTSDVDIQPEIIKRTVIDNLWNKVEVYVSSPTTQTATIVLGIRSVNNASDMLHPENYTGTTYGGCNDSNNAETGIQFDDVTMYEVVKWNRGCEPCDTIMVDANTNIEFQILLDKVLDELFTGGNFVDNVGALITSTNFEFDRPSYTVGQYFIIYIGTKIYAIYQHGGGLGLGYVLTTYGNLNRIDVWTGLDLDATNDKLKDALIGVIDANHGTTTTYNASSDHFVIANIPSGSYIYDPFSALTNKTTIGTTNGINYYNSYIDNKQLCFYKYTSVAPILFDMNRSINLIAGRTYKLYIKYSSEYDYNDFTNAKLYVNDGTNPQTDITFNIVNEEEYIELTAYYTALLTGAHTIGMSFEDVNLKLNGFCLDKYSVIQIPLLSDEIQKITYLDCNGTETEITNYLTNQYLYNILMQLPTLPITTLKILLYDKQGNIYESISMNVVDVNILHSCDLNKYLKVVWFDNCLVNNSIDYKNLPFSNEIYLLGSANSVSSITKENINYIGSNGETIAVYSRIIDVLSVTIGAYSNTLHRILSKILRLKFVYLNDKSITLENGSYEINQLRDAMSSAEFDASIKDSVVINSDCC